MSVAEGSVPLCDVFYFSTYGEISSFTEPKLFRSGISVIQNEKHQLCSYLQGHVSHIVEELWMYAVLHSKAGRHIRLEASSILNTAVTTVGASYSPWN